MRKKLEHSTFIKAKTNKPLTIKESLSFKHYSKIYLGQFCFFMSCLNKELSLPDPISWKISNKTIFLTQSNIEFQNILNIYKQSDHKKCLFIHNYILQFSKISNKKLYKI